MIQLPDEKRQEEIIKEIEIAEEKARNMSEKWKSRLSKKEEKIKS